MRKIYLITNNLVLNNIEYLSTETIDEKRAKRPLSFEGETLSNRMAVMDILKNVTSIYSSGFASALSTAKYLSHLLNIPINIDNKLNERKIGQLNKQVNLSFYKENQEHDFDYKLPGGESFNDVKSRLTKSFKEITKINQDDEIAIFSHNIAILSLLSNWCDISYNLDNRLILNYEEKVLENSSDIVIYELEFDDNMRLNNINDIVIN